MQALGMQATSPSAACLWNTAGARLASGASPRSLTASASTLAAADLSFSYHNHSFEFVQFGGRTGLELLLEETDPRYVQAELDTYWIQHGGGDPVAWIERVSGRMPVVHLKDMVMLPSADGRGQQAMAEVGAGNMNFPGDPGGLRSGQASSGTRSSRTSAAGDPFDSLAISYRKLQDLGLR